MRMVVEAALAFLTGTISQEAGTPALYERAERAREEGRAEEAVVAFRDLLRSQPDHLQAHLGYQKVLKSQKKDAELVEEYRKHLERNEEWWSYYLLGRVLRDAAREEELYRKGLALAEDRFELRIALADALRRQRRLKEAVEGYRAALKDRPDALREHVAYIKLLRDAGRIGEAVVEYARRAKKDESDYRGPLLLGSALITAGEIEQARRPIERALELAPRSPHALVTLGIYFTKAKNYDRAHESYERALREDPHFVGGLYQSGVLLHFVKKDALGFERLKEAARLEPDSSVILADLGAAYITRSDLNEAEEHLLRALKVDPTNDWAAHRMGLVCALRKDYTEAVNWQEKAIDLCSEIPEYYAALGRSHERVGNPERAKKAYEKAEQLKKRRANP